MVLYLTATMQATEAGQPVEFSDGLSIWKKMLNFFQTFKKAVAFLLHMLSNQKFKLKFLQHKHTMTPTLFPYSKTLAVGGKGVCYKVYTKQV